MEEILSEGGDADGGGGDSMRAESLGVVGCRRLVTAPTQQSDEGVSHDLSLSLLLFVSCLLICLMR